MSFFGKLNSIPIVVQWLKLSNSSSNMKSSFTVSLSLFIPIAIAAILPSPVHYEKTAVLAKRASCTPASAGDAGIDDVPAIEASIASCGKGGTIIIPAGLTYTIRSILDFTGCEGCIFNIEGTLKASDDLDFWEGKTAIMHMSGINTATIQSVAGTGVIDGNGQAAYDKFAVNSSYARPTLHYIDELSSHIAIRNLKVKNPPNVFFSVTGGSSNIAYSDLTMTAASKSTYAPKNTDGFDIGASTYVSLTNITVSNQDDCVAFKPGCNYASVRSITCVGSHGLSIGSLGKTNTDTVTNVYVQSATMINATKAVGIKVYPGGAAHGTSVVSNVTFDGVIVENCDYAAQIQSCYGETAAYCDSNPSTASITDVYFKNFQGETSTESAPVVANLDCPEAGTCEVYFEGWDVEAGSGTAEYLCANIDGSPGIACSEGASG
ncbi:Endo-xylogalacturonan hydrolase A [Lachnellula suecica]|uniref:Endo-xylogalacturonan hydrolase A n=1 Tax=Lachnellula suecica TaxID=602035 RepID=A0A8T9C4F4_9HELO|nr:Endo-xylogalacturonan hydrolase A [Lachnellula suecica]